MAKKLERKEVIVKDTRLTMDKIKFYRERKISDKVIDDFVETQQERNCLVKIGNPYYNLAFVS